MDWIGLANWLSKKGELEELNYFGGQGRSPSAVYVPRDKAINIVGNDQIMNPDRVLGHEILHALQFSNLPNRFQSQMQMLNDAYKDPANKDWIEALAFPTHWFKGQMEDERVTDVIPFLRDALARTKAKRDDAFKAFKYAYQPDEYQWERQAYHLTEPATGNPDQWKELGMYLRNYGVPLEQMEGLWAGLKTHKAPLAPIRY
jgi:hypothetical protein